MTDAAARRGAYLVYRGEHYRTIVVPERQYTLAVRLSGDVGLERFDAADIVATSGELPGAAWVALRPSSVERTYVTSATASWGDWQVWLAGPADPETGTVLVGSHDPFDDDVLSGRPSAGGPGVGWFVHAPLDELGAVELTDEPYQLP